VLLLANTLSGKYLAVNIWKSRIDFVFKDNINFDYSYIRHIIYFLFSRDGLYIFSFKSAYCSYNLSLYESDIKYNILYKANFKE